MEVVKRNGSKAPFNFAKVEKVIRFACENEEQVDKFISDLQIQLKNEMTTKDLQKSLISLAVEKTTVQEPQWDTVASKLYLYDLIKEAGINRGYKRFGYGDFYDLIKKLTEDGLYHKDVLKNYSKSQIKEAGSYIQPERDYLLSYVGIKILAERYMIKSHDEKVLELPQEGFMGVALFLALAEKPEERIERAKQFYDVLSQLYMIVATPTMSNARKPFNQLSSCFIATTDDSLESIFNVDDLFSQVSKHGGGFGNYIGKVRAANSDIRGFKNVSGGVVPWIRILNDTAVACNQLGVRQGSISITLDIWHRDIWDFLQLKTTNGDQRRKAFDIFPAVSIPDIYMRQLKEKGKFYLFCPHEIRTVMGWSLEDFYDDGVNNEFTKRYWECVTHPDIPKEEVNAMDLLKSIIKSATETGTPFLFFRDEVNRMNPNKHSGMIYSSNLCHEITQNQSPNGEVERKTITDKEGNEIIVEQRKSGDFVVCNLSSLNLGKTHTKETLSWVVPLAIRMMDNVINLNYYPVQEAKVTNQKYRAVGLGTYGYHHMLAHFGISWESEEHLKKADEIYEMIAYYAIKGSADLVKEGRTPYVHFEGSEWDTGEYFRRRGYTEGNSTSFKTEEWAELETYVHETGMRNAHLQAVAPNGSSAHYGNSTQSIDPIYSVLYYDEKKNQVVPIVAPELNSQTMWLYKPAHLIDQMWSIKANAVRQRHIDQSQSFNLYITPETKSIDLVKMYVKAWELGCKTIYYTRSQSIELEDCVSCAV